MTAFDSRLLAYTDTFGVRLTRPGSYRYTLSTHAGKATDDEEEQTTIEVRAAPPGRDRGRGRGRSHSLEVRRAGRRFAPGQAKLEVDAGDVVLWHAADSSAAGWTVRGAGPETEFDSRRLGAGCLYTHAFGLPGVYEWRDAYGGRIGGRIEVRSPEAREPKEAEAWMAKLAEGSLIIVKGREVQPRELSILTGQTVFWLIEDAPGIGITGTLVEEQ
jgi:plastocyanin